MQAVFPSPCALPPASAHVINGKHWDWRPGVALLEFPGGASCLSPRGPGEFPFGLELWGPLFFRMLAPPWVPLALPQ